MEVPAIFHLPQNYEEWPIPQKDYEGNGPIHARRAERGDPPFVISY